MIKVVSEEEIALTESLGYQPVFVERRKIQNFDEAIAGRIAKMSTTNYIIQISKKAERNYRLKGLKEI